MSDVISLARLVRPISPIESELKVCSSIQCHLFPRAAIEISGGDLQGASTQLRDVGGDYYARLASDGPAADDATVVLLRRTPITR